METTETTERPKAINDKISNFVNMLSQMTKDEIDSVKKILGPVQVIKGTRTGTRVSGKVQRTDKVIESVFAKQMALLIDVLPKEPTDLAAWTKLALDKGLETQQDPARITAYYKRQIIALGYAEEVK